MCHIPCNACQHEGIEFGRENHENLVELEEIAVGRHSQRSVIPLMFICIGIRHGIVTHHCFIFLLLERMVIIKGRSKGKDLYGELMIQFGFYEGTSAVIKLGGRFMAGCQFLESFDCPDGRILNGHCER